jgi:hypothetical protein
LVKKPSFTVNVGESETAYKTMIMKVYYEADWLPNEIYLLDSYTHSNEYTLIVADYPSNYTGNVVLSDIPDGKHTITVCTREYGLCVVDESVFWFHSFSIEASAEIQINKLADSIDITGVFITETEPPPLVSISSLENKTYNTSDIPLNLTVNKVVSSIKYSLDGEKTSPLQEIPPLTGLPNGTHNITVYATDETRNTGTSEIAFFTIEAREPFPTTLVATASGASVAIIGTVLLIYFIKRNR